MFEVGDLVFAKLVGHRHPHWPALVIETVNLEDQPLKGKSRGSFFKKTGTPIQSDKKCKVKVEAPRDNFNVKFFGTSQTAIVAADSLVLYDDDSVERFDTAKNMKHRFFKDALAQIAKMKSKLELKRITRSAEKNVDNRKRDIDPLIPKSGVKEEGEHKVMSNIMEQYQNQLMTGQDCSIPEELDKIPTSDHPILPQNNDQIVNLPSPPVALQTKCSLDHPKDHQKLDHPEGYQKLDHPEGYQKLNHPEGYQKLDHPEGYQKLNHPEGYQKLDHPEGYQKLNHPEGYQKLDHPEGYQKLNHPEGYQKLDHPESHQKGTDFLSSIPMDILLSSPTKGPLPDPINIPEANHFNQQDIAVSSPVANHDNENISVLDPVTNQQDISASPCVANHHDQEDISVLDPVTNFQDIAVSSPVATHPDQEDISVLDPLSNHHDIALSPCVANHHDQVDISVFGPVTHLQDIAVSSPIATHHDQEDISVLDPLSNHHDIALSPCVANHHDEVDISVFDPLTNIQDIAVSSPITTHHDQDDISVFNPVTNQQDIAVSSPVANHRDLKDISVLDPATKNQDITLSPYVANHDDQEDIYVFNPVTEHQDISRSSPIKILHYPQDLPDTSVSTLVVNHLNQQDICVSSPIKILHYRQDLQDTSISSPVANHCDRQDISGSITQVNHPRNLHPLVAVICDPQEHSNRQSCSSVPVVNDEAFLHPSVLSSSPSHHHQEQLNSQSCSSFPVVHDEVCSHSTVPSPKHSYDYNDEEQSNSPICSLFPVENDETHLESSISSNRNDFHSKLFSKSLRGDDLKTSNDTKALDIKSSDWSPIRKKRKLTVENDNASNGLSSSWTLDFNTTSVQDNLQESSSSWVEENLNEPSSSWVEENLNESSSSWVEENLQESSSSWVEENLNESSSSWVEENLNESSSSWVEENLEESFSCEENPCELSWVEPSFPEDLDDCKSVTCSDINKLVVGQNNFNHLDDSNDIKIEVLVSDQNYSGSDDIEPRNSDFNILSEEKLPHSEPRYFISNLLTGLIGYIIDAFFDDDFEAYCCDELFSVTQLEEHIKKFHRRTPANVTIKTCEW